MQALSSPWRSMKYVWKMMTLQKQDIYHELTPMSRVYSRIEMVIFSCSVTLGFSSFHRIPLCVLKHGDILIFIWIMFTPVLLITAGCFAEMAALMPAVGAHYHYCYSTICEIVAFLVGWLLIFAYTTIVMSKCIFMSEFIDNNLLDGWVSKNLRFAEGTGFLFFCVPGYVNILSPILAVTMAFQAAWAVRFTKRVVSLLTSISVIVLFILVIAFTTKMQFSSLNIADTSASEKIYDVLKVVYKALIGYESLSVLGEEAKDPTTTIPQSIMISARIIMFLNIIYSFTMSMCIPEQGLGDIDENNPLGSIVIKMGMPWLYWIAMLGSVCGFWCSTYGSMFIALRLFYAMSRDGMIMKDFSRIDRYTRKPAIPAMIFGLFIGFVTAFFSVKPDVGYACLIVAKIMTTVCLLITRYRIEKGPLLINSDKEKTEEKDTKSWVLINYPNSKTQPTETTHGISMILIYNSVLSALGSIYSVIVLYATKLGINNTFKMTGFGSLVFFIFFLSLLRLQPTNDRTNLSFITPYVPFFPFVAFTADVFSFLILYKKAWIYMLVWAILGVVFYFAYSIRHSQESRNLYPDGSRWSSVQPHADLAVESIMSFYQESPSRSAINFNPKS